MYKVLKKLSTRTFGERFSVTGYSIQLPNNSKTTFYLRNSHPYAIIIPLLNDDTMLLIKQYRFGAKKVSLEFPMGTVKGKKPAEIARQELKEETGYKCESMQLLTSFYLSPGWSTQVGYVYVAKGLIAGKARPEPYEFIDLAPTKIKDMEGLIRKKVVFDASAILSFYYYRHAYGNSA